MSDVRHTLTSPGEQWLEDLLTERRRKDAFRQLRACGTGIDFCSNDYLGFSRDPEIAGAVQTAFNEGAHALGATGSRLISGNSDQVEELESIIASFHRSEAALLFSSGYLANVGVLSSLLSRHDSIIFDDQCHASIRDGIRLSHARGISFRHNDLNDLEKKISLVRGRVFVVVESLYSMDGDFAPLGRIVETLRTSGAHLIVDEAHSTGVYGPHGAGCVVQTGIEEEVFARIVTFGKALGCHGAAVLGSRRLKDALVNFSRPFIYTTGMSPHVILAIRCAYLFLPQRDAQRQRLEEVIACYAAERSRIGADCVLPSDSPIQSVIIPGNRRVRAVAEAMRESGFEVRAIVSPTVAQGSERLRISLHAFNSPAEVSRLVTTLEQLLLAGGDT